MNPELQLILEMTYSFSAISRDIFYPNRENPENDAEHSLQLALLAWNIIEVDKLELDQEKVFKLCLSHDLVELYSGDVPLWGKKGHEEKEAREKQALDILKGKLENINTIPDLILEYKVRKTEEAKFVYGLDKLAPFLTQLKTDGRIWKKYNVTLEMALEVLNRQKSTSPYLIKYFDESIQYLIKNKEQFFNM